MCAPLTEARPRREMDSQRSANKQESDRLELIACSQSAEIDPGCETPGIKPHFVGPCRHFSVEKYGNLTSAGIGDDDGSVAS